MPTHRLTLLASFDGLSTHSQGGSALSKPTQEFLSTTLATVLQGYGLTETCGMAAILMPEFWRYESVGVPVPSVEIKLQGTRKVSLGPTRADAYPPTTMRPLALLDYKDAGYLNSNNPPQGEVLLRGGSVTQGYFKRDKENAEAFVDGWFRTGDIGQWNSDGTLSLIDRIK